MSTSPTLTDIAARDAISNYARALRDTANARLTYSLLGQMETMGALSAWAEQMEARNLGPIEASTLATSGDLAILAGAETAVHNATRAEEAARAEAQRAVLSLARAGATETDILALTDYLGGSSPVTDVLSAMAQDVLRVHDAS